MSILHPVDMATVRKLAGKRFKYVTNIVGQSSRVFNPLRQLYQSGVSLNQICEIVLEALRLQHGSGYGRSCFSRVRRSRAEIASHTTQSRKPRAPKSPPIWHSVEFSLRGGFRMGLQTSASVTGLSEIPVFQTVKKTMV